MTLRHKRVSCPSCAAKDTEIARLTERLKRETEDWAEDDSAIRDLVRPILGRAVTDGSPSGVPPLVNLVERLTADLAACATELRHAIKRHPEGCECVGHQVLARVETGEYEALAKVHPKLSRGQVWCLTCGSTLKVNSSECLATGWPKCCGYTMTIDDPHGVPDAT